MSTVAAASAVCTPTGIGSVPKSIGESVSAAATAALRASGDSLVIEISFVLSEGIASAGDGWFQSQIFAEHPTGGAA